MYQMCREIGLRIMQNPSEKHDLSIYWEDESLAPDADQSVLSPQAINRRCSDITKTRVNQVFTAAFCYDLAVDPATYQGPCVIKSNLNARHDGQIINCPVTEPQPGVVYQRLIDNHCSPTQVQDIRVPVLGNQIPFVYFKFKNNQERFTNETRRVEMHATTAVFSEKEIHAIRQFCFLMGLDYGELDILRHHPDGRIYVVDVNKTPWGPPRSISFARKKVAIQKMSQCFIQEFLTGSPFKGK
jgi:hypothetical protein